LSWCGNGYGTQVNQPWSYAPRSLISLYQASESRAYTSPYSTATTSHSETSPPDRATATQSVNIRDKQSSGMKEKRVAASFTSTKQLPTDTTAPYAAAHLDLPHLQVTGSLSITRVEEQTVLDAHKDSTSCYPTTRTVSPAEIYASSADATKKRVRICSPKLTSPQYGSVLTQLPQLSPTTKFKSHSSHMSLPS